MFSVGFLEIIILLAIALIILGPKNLLQISKDLAQIIYRLKSVKEDIHQTIVGTDSNEEHSQQRSQKNDKKQ